MEWMIRRRAHTYKNQAHTLHFGSSGPTCVLACSKISLKIHEKKRYIQYKFANGVTALAQFRALYSNRARPFNQWQRALYPNFTIKCIMKHDNGIIIFPFFKAVRILANVQPHIGLWIWLHELAAKTDNYSPFQINSLTPLRDCKH